MNTNCSLSRPAALARPFIAADTTELGRHGRLEHAHSILRNIRVIVVAALLALLSVPSMSGQGLLEFASPDPTKNVFNLLKISGNGTEAIGTTYWWDVHGPGLGQVWHWSPSRGFNYLPDDVFLSNGNDLTGNEYGGGLLLSGNGQVVVGIRWIASGSTYPTYLPELWRWTVDGGVEIVGVVPFQTRSPYEGYGSSVVNLVSYDGSTVVGTIGGADMDGEDYVNFRWSKAGGFVRLDRAAHVISASRDADVVLCRTLSSSLLIWKASGEVIPFPLDSSFSIGVAALSEDGKVVVGASEVNQLQNFLWRWDPTVGVEFLNLPANYADWAQFRIGVSSVSADGRTIAGSVAPILGGDPHSSITGPQQGWIWTDLAGFQVLPTPGGYNWIAGISSDGTTIWGYDAENVWRWTAAGGMHYLAQDFAPAFGLTDFGGATSSDGSVVLVNGWTNSESGFSTFFWLAAHRPVIETLSTNRATAGQGDVPLTIYGIGFLSGARVFLGSTELTTTYVGPTQLQTTIPSFALVASGDFSILQISVHGPTGAVSRPVGFTVMGSGVATKVDQMETAVATSGTTASVAIPPATESDGGISATLTVSGDESASVTVASYNADPSDSGNTSFEVAGQFLDLNASGVTEADSMRVYFYFPASAPTETLSLKFWNTRVTPAAWENVTPATIDPVSHRIEVVFDANSHPKITELDGTFFAPTVVPPIRFTGFLAPLGGADATGGSFTSPLRTFKAGSTIPVKFSATIGGAPLTTGVHLLQATKYSDATTGGTPIDATPQDAATTGNQFRLSDQDWQLNLDTKSTGLTRGIWQLAATLSDGSQHTVWIQLK